MPVNSEDASRSESGLEAREDGERCESEMLLMVTDGVVNAFAVCHVVVAVDMGLADTEPSSKGDDRERSLSGIVSAWVLRSVLGGDGGSCGCNNGDCGCSKMMSGVLCAEIGSIG